MMHLPDAAGAANRRFDGWFNSHVRIINGHYTCSPNAIARENTIGRVVVSFYRDAQGRAGAKVQSVMDDGTIGGRTGYTKVSW